MLIILIYEYKPNMKCFSAVFLCLSNIFYGLSYNIYAYIYYKFSNFLNPSLYGAIHFCLALPTFNIIIQRLIFYNLIFRRRNHS